MTRCWVYRTTFDGAVRVRQGVEVAVEKIDVRIEGEDTTVHIFPDEAALQDGRDPGNAFAIRIEE